VGSLAQGFLEGARQAGMPEKALSSFPDAESARAVVDLLTAGDAVLVKGSRGMHLESIVEAIASRFGAGQG
jgi:UDP-N-acetylmuramyl pentapeptide synthase